MKLKPRYKSCKINKYQPYNSDSINNFACQSAPSYLYPVVSLCGVRSSVISSDEDATHFPLFVPLAFSFSTWDDAKASLGQLDSPRINGHNPK